MSNPNRRHPRYLFRDQLEGFFPETEPPPPPPEEEFEDPLEHEVAELRALETSGR